MGQSTWGFYLNKLLQLFGKQIIFCLIIIKEAKMDGQRPGPSNNDDQLRKQFEEMKLQMEQQQKQKEIMEQKLLKQEEIIGNLVEQKSMRSQQSSSKPSRSIRTIEFQQQKQKIEEQEKEIK